MRLIVWYLVVWASSVVAVTHASSATTTMTVSPSPVATATTDDGDKENVIVELFKYVKTSVTRTVNGCGELWTNHGRCNAIRSKIKGYRAKIRDHWEEQGLFTNPQYSPKELKLQLDQLTGGINYEEFAFLQKGKEDRSKVLNLLFLVFGAPRFLPYALMFNPEMLPSPLKPPLPGTADASGSSLVETIFEKTARQRSAIIIQTLLDLEKDAREVPYLAKLNIFAKKKQERKLQENLSFNQHAIQFLSNHMDTPTTSSSSSTPSPSSFEGAKQLLRQLNPYLVQTSRDFTRAEKRLCQVPPSIITGLTNCFNGKSFLASLAPNAFLRGQLVGHLKKVQDADKFITDSKIDLTTISPRLLQEACQDRMIGGPAYTAPELQATLRDWLTLLSNPPTQQEQEQEQTLDKEGSVVQGQPAVPGVYYNENLARVALLSYYGLQGTRDARNRQSALPRLLFSPVATTTTTPVTTSGTSSNNAEEMAKEEKPGRWRRK